MDDNAPKLSQITFVCRKLGFFGQTYEDVKLGNSPNSNGRLPKQYVKDLEEVVGLLGSLIGKADNTELLACLGLLYLFKRYPLPNPKTRKLRKIFRSIGIGISHVNHVLENDNSISDFNLLVKPDLTETEILLYILSH